MSLAAALTKLAPEAKNIRILTLDIEWRPMVSYHWGLWDQNISMGQIIDDGGLLCFAAKWMGSKEILFYSENDGHQVMVQAAHDLLTEADILVTYNGDKYDIKKLNGEFMLAKMSPPKPFKSIDVMKSNKGRFDLPSRKLDFLAQRTGVGAKTVHTGFALWVDCIAGDPKAWALMEKYNRQDVKVTEGCYLRILPWMTNTPHLGMYTQGQFSCPYCASTKLKRHVDPTHTLVQAYTLFECTNCHGWVRGVTRQQDPTRTRAIR
jgi:hypothetical protein